MVDDTPKLIVLDLQAKEKAEARFQKALQELRESEDGKPKLTIKHEGKEYDVAFNLETVEEKI